MIVLVNLILILIIIFIGWWFWFYKPKAPKSILSDHVTIIVENGIFSPDLIRAEVYQPVTLEFVRKDKSHCASTVQIPAFNQNLDLPIDKPGKIIITPDKLGEFDFECPMKMYKGTIVVEKGKEKEAGVIEIIVDGGVYIPDEIRIPLGNPVTLRFLRKDSSHCAKTVVFADFEISEDLPLGEPKEITILPKEQGQFKFACPMGMYVGKLIVE